MYTNAFMFTKKLQIAVFNINKMITRKGAREEAEQTKNTSGWTVDPKELSLPISSTRKSSQSQEEEPGDKANDAPKVLEVDLNMFIDQVDHQDWQKTFIEFLKKGQLPKEQKKQSKCTKDGMAISNNRGLIGCATTLHEI